MVSWSLRTLAAFVGMTLVTPVGAGFNQSGYLKNLTIGTRSVVDDAPYYSNLTRLRWEPRYSGQDWTLTAAYDLDVLSGSFLDTPEYELLKEAPDPRYWPLQDKLHESGDVVVGQQIYRATVQWRSALGDLRFGRQQINWSTALIWNPMDILNPVSPLQLEPDERIGVDALLWDTPSDALGRMSVVYAPQHNADNASTALRITRYLAGIDAGVMAGRFGDEDKAGVSGSGAVGGTGWRTEAVWSNPDHADNYWQAVADLNWSLQNGVNLALEYFYNGNPTPELTMGLGRLVTTTPVYASRHYTGALIWQDLTAIWRYRVAAIRNADDASWVLYPRSTWALPFPAEIYLTAGAQVFGGNDHTEYGEQKPLGLLEAQWFF